MPHIDDDDSSVFLPDSECDNAEDLYGDEEDCLWDPMPGQD